VGWGETAHSPLAPETVLFSYMSVPEGRGAGGTRCGARGDLGVAAAWGWGLLRRRERSEVVEAGGLALRRTATEGVWGRGGDYF
jgi:hypothetical protein